MTTPIPHLLFTENYGEPVRGLIRSSMPAGWGVQFLQESQIRSLEAVNVLCSGAAGAPAAMLGQLPALALVQHLAVGTDKIDRGVCLDRHIAVARLAGANAVPVAEHTVLMMLAALRRLP